MGELTGKDLMEISAKTALSMIPIGGTLATSVWDSVKSNAAQKRFEEWQSLIEERLSKLEITLDDVGSNEIFATAIMKATDSAIKTMEKEKREYLADAVLNSISINIEESLMMIYLDLVDKYTLWHIKILDFFSEPTKFDGVSSSKYYMGSPLTVLNEVYMELKEYETIVDKIIKELYTDGLLNTENMHASMTRNGMVASRTTELGNNFIAFITK